MAKSFFAVLISTGGAYGPKAGWDTAFATRAEAKACAARARRNDGWATKVVAMTADEARRLGWV